MTYELEYSKRKSVTISVKGGKLIVKAPYHTKKEDIQKILEKHRRWIENHLSAAIKKEALENAMTDERISELKRAAKAYFTETAARYASVMGLSYTKITITSTRGRFGSCSSKGSICFSYRLMLYPTAAREYVVVHELAHLRHMNHSPDFYAVVKKYMPDYEERRALLKKTPI